MTYEEFKKAFKRVKSMGFVPSQRKGNTGVGHTLEQLLGFKENNIALPDLGEAELKAHRINSSSMITLFTFNKKAWIVNPWKAIQEYGTPDENGRLGMYFTMSKIPNSAGLFLHLDDAHVSVRHIKGETIVQWKFVDLAKQFRNKIPSALVFVSAHSEMRGNKEWFHYVRARLLTGTSPEIIHEQIDSGNILIDLRLHDQGACARNHGTGFRVHEDKLELLFSKIEEVE